MPSGYRDIAVGGGDTAQPLALEKRLRVIRRYLAPGGGRFLDCGCGAGEYVFQLVDQLGLDTYGIEHDAEKTRLGKLHPTHGHRISEGDIQAIESESRRWDYAMLNEVLEHVPDDSAALREVHRILKVGGRLFIFSPNRWFPFETHGVHLKSSGRRVPHWVPFVPYVPLALGQHVFGYWARNYWQGELRRLAVSAGFSIVETDFVWQTFEGISGHQPGAVRLLRPLLRGVANAAEKVPFVQRFAVSQVLVCERA